MTKPSKNRKIYVWGILATTLCGLKVKVIYSKNLQLTNLVGEIEDESAQMLRILSKGKVKWIPKADNIFEIHLPDNSKVRVNGQILQGTPENRLKKRLPNW